MKTRSIVLLLAAALSLSPALYADGHGADEGDSNITAEHQFDQNAKLAGRALACRDQPGKAGIRMASRNLALALAGEAGLRAYMQRFDQNTDRHQRFAERARIRPQSCSNNVRAIEDNLSRTRRIAVNLGYKAARL